MGEVVSIAIGSYDFLSCKNSFGDLLLLFSNDNLRVTKAFYEDDSGDEYNQYVFTTTVEKARRCLDSLGYSMECARKSFELSKDEEIRFLEEYSLGNGNDKFGYSIDDIYSEFTFENWSEAVRRFALLLSKDNWDDKKYEYHHLEIQRQSKELTLAEKYVLDSLPFDKNGHFFGIQFKCTSIWEVFRIILDAFEPEQEIKLDYTNLYNGGWCDEFPTDDEYATSKTLVMTEGKYDAEVISRSIKVLYPYMYKFYSFIDFSGANVQGSAGALTQYVKAFIGAGIQNRVIALYDNDAVGQCELEYLRKMKLPRNFTVMALPDISLADNYPTIGPTSNECVNINGRACSIELYLGRDILLSDGQLKPIMWKGYIEKIGAYQGELIDKSGVQRKFEQKILYAESNGIFRQEDWAEMDSILNSIFSAFL